LQFLDTKFKCYEWLLGTWSFGSSLASLLDGCHANLSSSIWCSDICKDICWFDACALPFKIYQNVCACGLFAFHSQWLMRNQSLHSTENQVKCLFGNAVQPAPSQSLGPAFVCKPNRRICFIRKDFYRCSNSLRINMFWSCYETKFHNK